MTLDFDVAKGQGVEQEAILIEHLAAAHEHIEKAGEQAQMLEKDVG